MARFINLDTVSMTDLAPREEIQKIRIHAIIPEESCPHCKAGKGEHIHTVPDRYEEAHTHGLNQIGAPEICIRNISSKAAGWLVNTVNAYVLQNGPESIAEGDVIQIGGVAHVLIKDVDAGDEPVLRLHWLNDPAWQPEDAARLVV